MTKLKGTRHTRYFSNLDEVEYIFGRTFNSEQAIMVMDYIVTGTRPDTQGCWSCSPAEIRILTGQIDRFEDDVEYGFVAWPWPKQPVRVFAHLNHPEPDEDGVQRYSVHEAHPGQTPKYVAVADNLTLDEAEAYIAAHGEWYAGG